MTDEGQEVPAQETAATEAKPEENQEPKQEESQEPKQEESQEPKQEEIEEPKPEEVPEPKLDETQESKPPEPTATSTPMKPEEGETKRKSLKEARKSKAEAEAPSEMKKSKTEIEAPLETSKSKTETEAPSEMKKSKTEIEAPLETSKSKTETEAQSEIRKSIDKKQSQTQQIEEKQKSVIETDKVPSEIMKEQRVSTIEGQEITSPEISDSKASVDRKRSSEIPLGGSDRKATRSSLAKEDLAKERKKSIGMKAKNVLGSTISIRRLSTGGEYYDRTKGARFMNSYKLDSDNPFNPEKVQKILESVMVEAFENLTYDPDKCPKQAKWASSAIRAKVKELQFDRYKLICLVTIGEKTSQDIYVTCRFLWDVDRDRYAKFCIENTYVFGIAQCFGIYYE